MGDVIIGMEDGGMDKSRSVDSLQVLENSRKQIIS